MDRDLPLFPSLVFIASLIITIALYMQVAPQLYRPPVSQFLVNDDGVGIVYKDRLIGVDGDFPNVDLTSYNINQYVGEIMRMSNGDLVLNTAGQSTSLLHKWRRYLRQSEAQPKRQSSLLRCDPQFISCAPWGGDALHFDTPWSGLSISDDRNIILDTARHLIYLLNDNGELLDTLDGFKFPNHAIQDGSYIWVVDTNRNRLVPLRVQANRLSEAGDPISLYSFNGISTKHRFPSMVYKKGDVWYVLAHANGMNDGKVYRLENGEAVQLFEQRKDITTLYFNDDTLFITSFLDHSLWSMGIITGDTKRLESSSFDNALLSVDKKIGLQRLEFYLYAGFISAIGIFALIFSLIKSKPSTVNTKRILVLPHTEISSFGGASDKIVWLSKSNKFLELQKKAQRYLVFFNWLIAAIVVSILILAFQLGGTNDKLLELVLLMLPLCVMLLSIHWVIKLSSSALLGTRLGADGESVFVEDIASNRRRKLDMKSAIYSSNDLYDGTVYIAWQSYNKVFYNKAEFESLISPLLGKARKVSPIRIYLRRLRFGERSALIELTIITVSIIAYLSLKSLNVI